MAAIRDACSLQLFSRAALYSVCRQYCLISKSLPGSLDYMSALVASNAVSSPCERTSLLNESAAQSLDTVCLCMGTQKWPCQVLTKAPHKDFWLNVWQMHRTIGEVSADVLYLMQRRAWRLRMHTHTCARTRTRAHTLCCALMCSLPNGQWCQPVQLSRQACKLDRTDLRYSQLPAGTLQDLVGALLCQGPQFHTGLGHLLLPHSSPEPVSCLPALTNSTGACSLLA